MTPQHTPSAPSRGAKRHTPEHDAVPVHAGSAGALALAAGFGALLAAVSEIGAAGSLWTLVPGLLLVGAGQGLTITPQP